jgi:alpha-mannosidase
MMAFYGVGDHGGGPTRTNLDSIRRLDAAGSMPRLLHSTPRRFFDAVGPSADGLPVFAGELQHHAIGCYAAHSGVKRWIRRAEGMLAAAEVWATLSTAVAGQHYPAPDLRRAWKQVLFNQFHDTFGGTAIEPAYEDARDQLGEACSIAARAHNLAVQSISRQIGIAAGPGEVPIVVFNPHPWPVTTTVELEYGDLRSTDGLVDDEGRAVAHQDVQSYATVRPWRSRVAFEADVPALGYRTYRMTPRGARPGPSPLRAEGTTLENERIRLELDLASGATAALVLREDGHDVVDLNGSGGSRAAILDDTSDTWGHRLLSYRTEIDRFEATNVELIEAGPVRGILRVDSRYGDSRLIQDYVLSAQADAVEVRVILDWREKARLLKLRFPTALDDVVAAYEIPYGVLERAPNGDEEPGQRWIDVTGHLAESDERFGLAILNDGKYAFDCDRGEPAVTAVRSPIYAHHEPTLPSPGVRYQFQDQGIQRFTLTLVPHRGGWADAGLTRRAMVVNQAPTVLLESGHDGPLPGAASYGRLEPDTVVLGALKVAEDGDDVVVRVAETAGRTGDVLIGLPVLGREIRFAIAPFEIRTFRVPRDAGRDPHEVDLLERPSTDRSL